MRWVGVVFLACALALAGWQFSAGRQMWRTDCEDLAGRLEQGRQTASERWRAEETRLQEEQGKVTASREQRLALEETLTQKKAEAEDLKRKIEAAGRSVSEAGRGATVDLEELTRTRQEVTTLRAEIEPLERRVADLPAAPTPPRN